MIQVLEIFQKSWKVSDMIPMAMSQEDMGNLVFRPLFEEWDDDGVVGWIDKKRLARIFSKEEIGIIVREKSNWEHFHF